MTGVACPSTPGRVDCGDAGGSRSFQSSRDYSEPKFLALLVNEQSRQRRWAGCRKTGAEGIGFVVVRFHCLGSPTPKRELSRWIGPRPWQVPSTDSTIAS